MILEIDKHNLIRTFRIQSREWTEELIIGETIASEQLVSSRGRANENSCTHVAEKQICEAISIERGHAKRKLRRLRNQNNSGTLSCVYE